MHELTQQQLKDVLSYDPLTGIFRWKVNRPRARAGQDAGYLNSRGYKRVQIDGQAYALHRLAFLYIDGELPEGDVDHINRDRIDNRFENLRRASRAANLRNKGTYRRSALGMPGVSQRGQRFRAYINRDGNRFNLGTYDTAEEASEAYWSAKRELHPEYSPCPH